MRELRAVAWDIDGTLVDSESLHHRALLETCRSYGANLDDLSEDFFRGVHLFDVWVSLRPRLPPLLHQRAWMDAIDRFYCEHAGDLVAMPEALETMSALSARGIAQACVSNSSRAVVDANIAALGIADWIAFSISLDDVSAGKPDPGPYRLAALRLAAPVSAIAAVEDSAVGAISARAAGLLVVRYAPDGEREGFADRWITELSEVLALCK